MTEEVGPRDREEWRQRRAADPRTNEELLAIARRAWNDDSTDADLEALSVIAARATKTELELALRLSRAAETAEREMAAFVLGRFGTIDNPSFPDETIPRLIELTRDDEQGVVVSATYALGHRNSARCLPRLVELSRHAEPDVRVAVAHALAFPLAEEEVIEALVRLTADPEAEVRDWATFALGTQHDDLDTPEVRAALHARLTDEDATVRGEALVGLALRRDPAAVPAIRRELAGEDFSNLAFEAAGHTEDPSLIRDLERWMSIRPNRELMDAIANLRGTG
jgi:HEAT repeat protein